MPQSLAFKIEKEVLEFLKQAGKLAISMRESAKDYTKEDGSIVTDVDLAISKAFAEQFAEYFSSGRHILIDEESAKKSPEEVFASNAKYIWTLDPIDGTDPFANELPMWGIQAGVLKDNKPWLGFIYLADMDILYVHNGENFYQLKNGKKTIYKKGDVINPKGKQFVIANNCTPAQTANYDFGFNPYSAVCVFPWIAIGGLIGICTKSTSFGGVWDWAPAWPMLEHTGKQIRNFTNGEIQHNLKQIISPEWKFNQHVIISDEKNFNKLQKIIKFDK